MNEQMDLFGATYEEHSFPKKIRLIELFGLDYVSAIEGYAEKLHKETLE